MEGDRCTFLWRGEADAVHLVHRITGLPDRLPLRRLWGTDLWSVVLELPTGSRVNYQIEVRRGEHVESGNDPLNPKVSYSPVGTSSVCFANGYTTPEWTEPDPDARPGALTELVVPSRALRRDCPVARLPACPLPRAHTYPLLVVHDGGDFLQYAAAKTVLDNLVHRLDVAELVVAFLHPGDRLLEYADSPAHARFLTRELLPRLEAELPLIGQRSGRCLLGSSFGAVASLAAGLPLARHLRLARADVGLVRVHRHRRGRPRRGTGVRPGRQVRQPLSGPAPAGRRPAVRQLRGV